jgi:hypothetical protein
MEREVITFTERNDICGIVGGWEHRDEWEVVSNDMVDQSRWSITHEVILRRRSDGKFFWTYYTVGATESQDHGMYEDDDMVLKEVIPTEKTIIVYGWSDAQ